MNHYFTKRLAGLLLFTLLSWVSISSRAANNPESGCGIPANVRCVNATASCLFFEWDVIPEASSYMLQMRKVGTVDWTLAFQSFTTSAMFSNLPARTNYEYRISAICDSGQSPYSDPLTCATTVECTAPNNIILSKVSMYGASLQWNKVERADKYNVQYKAANETTWRNIETTNLNLNITGLTPGTYYQYKICAICATYSAIECSNTFAFTTSSGTSSSCGIVSNLVTTNITSLSALLNWSAVTGATAYQVRYRVDGASTWITLPNVTTANATVTGLQANTNYEWQVRAICGSTEGAFCYSSFFKTALNTVCDAPTNVRITDVTASSLSVAWNTVSSANKYIVEYKATSESSWRAVEVTGNSTVLTGLLSNATYQFRVCAVCPGCPTNGCSAYLYCSTLSGASCGVVTNLNESNITASSALLTWSGVSGATSYRVRVKVYNSTLWSQTLTTTSTSLNVTGLNSNTTYEWQVQAICGSTEGVYCDLELFTTNAPLVCNPPINLRVVSVTSTSAQLSWGAVSNASKYIVEYTLINSGYTQTLETTGTTATINGLLPNTSYQFRICAVCPNCATNGCSIWCPFTTLVSASCGNPTALDETGITTNYARLTWVGVAGATAYRIRIRVYGTTAWLAEATVSGTTANANYLNSNTTYEWQVMAICGSVSGSYAATSTFVTLGVCSAPTGLIATNIASTSATLNWASVSQATKYIVQYRAIGETTWRSVETTSSPLVINNLVSNTQYEFKVCAVCPGCIDPFCSAVCLFKTTTPPCTAPTNLLAINITTTGATLTWSAVPYATKYTVQYMPVGESNWRTVETTNTSLTVNDLSPNVDYQFRVCVMCSGVSGSYCSNLKDFRTLQISCTAPFNLVATNITSNGSTLTWTAVPYASKYTVQYMAVGETVWKSVETTTNSVTINDLSPDVNYQFRVCSMCSGVTGSYCSTICLFKTLPPSCPAPNNLAAINISTNGATLIWSAVPYATKYTVQYMPIGETNWRTVETTNTSITVSDLSPNVDYQFRVCVMCTGVTGSYCSSIYTFKTLQPACTAPSTVSVNNVTTTGATFTWSAVPYATKYTVQYMAVGETVWKTVETTNTTLTVNDLSANKSYQVRVCVMCTGVTGSYCSTIYTFKTVSPSCSAPTDLIVTDITSMGAKFSWSTVPNATKYVVQYMPSNETEWRTVETTNTMLTVNDLSQNRTHIVIVCAMCAGDDKSYCTEKVMFKTTTPICGTPINLVPLNITATSARLTWSSVPYSTLYIVQYAKAGQTNWQNIETTENFAVVNDLSPNTSYQFRVCVMCSSVSGTFCSDLCPFTTLLTSCAAPTGLAANNISSTGATFSWTAVPTASKYTVQYKSVSESNWRTVETTTNSLNVNDLVSNTTYQFRVCVMCTDVNGSFCSDLVSFSTSVTANCVAPTNLSANNISISGATLTWSAVASANRYIVQYKATSETAWRTAEVSSNSLGINDLAPNTSYQFRVCTVCTGVSGTYCSDLSTFTTTAPSCTAPTNLSASNITFTTAVLSWSTVPYASKYIVQYMPTSEAAWKTVEVTTNSLTVTDLSANNNYQFRVCVMCTGVSGSYCSSTYGFSTPQPTCNPPSNLAATNVTSTGATFTWLTPQYGSRYAVQYAPVGTSSWKTVETTNNTLTVNDLSPNTNYQFRVCTMCTGFSGTYCSNTVNFTTLPLPCTAPTNLTANNITSTGATISWSPVVGVSSYKVEYMLSTESAWRTINTTNTTVDITDLSPNTQYTFRVCIICTGGSSYTCSNQYYFTTQQSTCGIPTNLMAYNITPTGVVLNWGAVAGANSYRFRVRPSNSSVWIKEGIVSATNVAVTGLSASTNYVWQIAAICSSGEGVYSSLSQFQTLATSAVCINDEVCQSINLNVTTTFTYTNGSNNNATTSTSPAYPSSCPCPTKAYDVWYSATIPSTGRMTVNVTGESGFIPVVAIYYGSNCSSINYLGCQFETNPASGVCSPTISLSGSPGVNIYIRVWGYNGQFGNFKIGVADNVTSARTTSLMSPKDIVSETAKTKSIEGGEFNSDNSTSFSMPTLLAGAPKEMLVNVYPNPVRQALNLEYVLDSNDSNVSISLQDISGRTIYWQNTEGVKGRNYQLIRTDAVANGLYILKVTSNQQQKVQKVQITH